MKKEKSKKEKRIGHIKLAISVTNTWTDTSIYNQCVKEFRVRITLFLTNIEI